MFSHASKKIVIHLEKRMCHSHRGNNITSLKLNHIENQTQNQNQNKVQLDEIMEEMKKQTKLLEEMRNVLIYSMMNNKNPQV